MSLRIYLTGQLHIDAGVGQLSSRGFAGKQGRLAFAYLVLQHGRAVPKEDMATALWPDEPPASWELALAAVISNLRTTLSRIGLARSGAILSTSGCYQLRLPAQSWIDVEEARHALDLAEGALRGHDPGRAYGWAGVTTAIARRTFLPGEAGAWVEGQRESLHQILLRGLDCFVEIFLWNGETALAIAAAEEAVRRAPYRETGHKRLMQVHQAMGNRAEALRAYTRCRKLLLRELGVDPSQQIEALHREILQSC